MPRSRWSAAKWQAWRRTRPRPHRALTLAARSSFARIRRASKARGQYRKRRRTSRFGSGSFPGGTALGLGKAFGLSRARLGGSGLVGGGRFVLGSRPAGRARRRLDYGSAPVGFGSRVPGHLLQRSDAGLAAAARERRARIQRIYRARSQGPVSGALNAMSQHVWDYLGYPPHSDDDVRIGSGLASTQEALQRLQSQYESDVDQLVAADDRPRSSLDPLEEERDTFPELDLAVASANYPYGVGGGGGAARARGATAESDLTYYHTGRDGKHRPTHDEL